MTFRSFWQPCRYCMLGWSLISSGCMNQYYSPGAVNSPMFRQKGEFRGMAAMSVQSYTTGIDANAAYAFTDHLALTAEFARHTSSSASNRMFDRRWGYGNNWGVGGGYYTLLPGEWLTLEALGGLAFGDVTNNFPNSGIVRTNFSKYYIQPGAAILSSLVDVGFSMRMGMLAFGNLRDYTNGDPNAAGHMTILRDNRLNFITESALTVRAGFNQVKFQLQGVAVVAPAAIRQHIQTGSLSLGMVICVPYRPLRTTTVQ